VFIKTAVGPYFLQWQRNFYMQRAKRERWEKRKKEGQKEGKEKEKGKEKRKKEGEQSGKGGKSGKKKKRKRKERNGKKP